MKILIVDDSPAMQTIIKRGIEQLGYENIQLKKSTNAKEALDVIRVWEPELIISDWHMADMTGLELLAFINSEMLGINMGFVTPERSPDKIQQAMDAGASFIVQTPFDFKTLHEAVLPIIQGSLEGEKALEEQPITCVEPDTKISEHIDLPTPDSLAKAINALSSKPVMVKSTNFMKLEPNNFPYLLGLYEDSEERVVRAIAILNIHAACTLGASMGGIGEGTIHIATAEKALPKLVIDNCHKLLSPLGTSLQSNTQQHPLTLRSVNLMRKHNPSIENLLKKGPQERLDVAVKTKEHNMGYLTFIVS